MIFFVRLANKIRRINDVTHFVGGFFERIWMWGILFLAEVAETIGFAVPISRHAWRIEEKGEHFLLHTRGDFSDVKLFRDIFFKRPYETRIPFPVKTIVDLGANIGVTTLFFYTRFPEARIVAVEANPHLMPVLEKNIKNIPHGCVVHAAVTNHTGEEFLHIGAASVSSSLFIRERGSEVETVSVPATTLSELVHNQQLSTIDLLKIDIEGAEWEVFSDPAFAQNVRSVIGEIHVDIAKHSIEEFRDVLEAHFVTTITKTNQVDRYIVTAFRK